MCDEIKQLDTRLYLSYHNRGVILMVYTTGWLSGQRKEVKGGLAMEVYMMYSQKKRLSLPLLVFNKKLNASLLTPDYGTNYLASLFHTI